ncbi:molybdate ABC transporter substrate-binding protein [Candidatus Bathyarchaeota archaeon RBG_13_38_9]|nr:MAG: molybdate ABC transporter substrate-binding protein [Candidatus Bathyarchaeota archaeon RBG_13_38_9]
MFFAITGSALLVFGSEIIRKNNYIQFSDSENTSASPTPILGQPESSLTSNLSPSTINMTRELRVFAAASLANVVNAHKPKFEKENNVKLMFNFGSSNSLYQQLFSGAPADVYLSADLRWTKKLNESELLYKNEYYSFTKNKLVVIIPEDNPKNISSLLDLTRPDVKVIIATPTSPIGTNTNITLTKIGEIWGDEHSPQYRGAQWKNYRDRVVKNIISYEPSVSQVVSKVALGVCDAGFVYISDTKSQQSGLKYFDIPDEVNTIGIYGIAVMNTVSKLSVAEKYVEFWLSDEGQMLLADYGFGEGPLEQE